MDLLWPSGLVTDGNRISPAGMCNDSVLIHDWWSWTWRRSTSTGLSWAPLWSSVVGPVLWWHSAASCYSPGSVTVLHSSHTDRKRSGALRAEHVAAAAAGWSSLKFSPIFWLMVQKSPHRCLLVALSARSDQLQSYWDYSDRYEDTLVSIQTVLLKWFHQLSYKHVSLSTTSIKSSPLVSPLKIRVSRWCLKWPHFDYLNVLYSHMLNL